MRVAMYVSGALLFAVIMMNMTTAMEAAQDGASEEEIQAAMTEVPTKPSKRGKRHKDEPPPPPVIQPPAEVSPKLLLGWQARELKKKDGVTELYVEGPKTLDRVELEGRLRMEGCYEPEIVTEPKWEIRCPTAGRLVGVTFRQGDGPGKGVLTWTGLAW